MGWGDEIMVTAQARRMQEKDPRAVHVTDRYGVARWHPIWDGNPRIARPSYLPRGGVQVLRNYPGNRPYLDYRRFNNADRAQAYVYTDFRVEPGEIYLSAAELRLAGLARGAVIVEPNIKSKASPNKDWGWERWEALVRELRWRDRDLRLVQIGGAASRSLPLVERIVTPTVREACGVLSGAALLISPEGGLHHAAAALGIRAVVIFGGFISPQTTGYDCHLNLFTGGRACGMRQPCAHCSSAMAAIAPAAVAGSALEFLRGGESHALRLSAAG